MSKQPQRDARRLHPHLLFITGAVLLLQPEIIYSSLRQSTPAHLPSHTQTSFDIIASLFTSQSLSSTLVHSNSPPTL